MIEIEIGAADAGQRIDKYVRKYLKQAPLSLIYRLFRKGDIKLNGRKVDIAAIIQNADILRIYIDENKLPEFRKEIRVSKNKRAIQVCYEDENILAVNKEKGIEIQRNDNKTTLNLSQMVIDYLADKGEFQLGDVFIPSPAHRLDRNTSGVILFGKNIKTLQQLLQIFKNHQIEKRYLAIVVGHPPKKNTIKSWLHKSDNYVKIVNADNENGKEAILEFRTIEYFEDCSLIEVYLKTGRTHQIRVQLQSIGHPIAGDEKYGDFDFNKYFFKKFAVNNLFLHSDSLKIVSGGNVLSYMENVTINAELPLDFLNILKNLRKKPDN